MKQAMVLDIRQFIDEQPFSRYQLLIAVMCGAMVFMDGFDAQAMGFVAPALTAQLKITRAALGPAISSGLFGMMIGALVCGPLADRFGRKPVLVGCTLMFGFGALLTATAGSLESLLFFRLFTGLGLGGAMPNAIALTSEYAPKKFRATAVMTMFTGFSIGAAVGGFVAAGLISQFGWQSVFIVGGILPLVIGVLSMVLLPESIRFLVLRGGNRERVARYLSRIAPNSGPFEEMSVGADEHQSGGFVVKRLFTEGRARVTPFIWVMFFMNLLDLYFLNSWLPTVAFLACAYFGAAASIFLIGEAGASIALLVLTVSAAGFCVIGGQTGSNALTAEFYPTAIRSTGIGWALGIGRIGSIIGPTLGGALLSMGGQTRHVFWAAAIPVLIATVAASGAALVVRKGN